MIKVIAVDPGITTGFASGLIDPDKGVMEVTADQEILQVDGMYNLLTSTKPDILIFETFEFRRNQKRNKLVLFSKELIGIMEFWVRQQGFNLDGTNKVHVHRQSPGQVINSFYTDKELKNNNVYRKGMPHANDAMRHLLHWYHFGPGYKYNKEGYRPA